MSDRISIDLDDLDDDLLEAQNDFDVILSNNAQYLPMPDEEEPTLESILNENDDLENDEILKSLTSSLTTIDQGKKNAINRENSQFSDSLKSRSNSTNANTQYNSLIEVNGFVCKQTSLKQISSQLINAIERSDAGLPTVLAVSQLIAVGTSRGLILLFDLSQILKLYITTEYKDAISAVSLNNKCDRLLVGNSSGYIFMFDTTNGKCLRKITEAHPYGNAVLNLKFTDDSKLACFSDSGGSVFMLEFKRVMGVRGADSTCLFSGSRGEVCHIEPLKFEKFSESIIDRLKSNDNTVRTSVVKKNLDNISSLFNKYSMLAMASFTKIFVVTLRPKLNVLFTFPLTGGAKYLPIINWQFVIMQPPANSQSDPKANTQNKRYVTPILSCARESTIHFFQIDYFFNKNQNSNGDSTSSNNNSNNMSTDDAEKQFKFVYLKKNEYNFKIYNFCWLNAKTIAILDNTEKLHIFDIRTNEQLQVMSNLPECVQLVYNCSFFKSLSTGGYVSKALAFAGENACYQTFQSHLGQLFMLGTRSINLFSLQNWSTRIDDFVNDNNLDLAIDLALSMFKGETKALIGLPMDSKQRKQKIIEKIVDILYLYVNRTLKQDAPFYGKLDVLEKHYKKSSSKCVKVCMLIGRQDILFDNLYNLLSCDRLFEGFFFESLEEHILSNKLKQIPPVIIKNFINYYIDNPSMHSNLEKCLFHFDISNIDLHNVMQICKKHSLIDAYIYFYNKALGDYITPFEELIQILDPLMFLNYETAKQTLKKSLTSTNNSQTKNRYELTTYGNKLLVYLHCCLCGQSYPYGPLNDDDLSDRVRRTTFDYLTSKRNKMIDKLLLEEKEKVNKGEESKIGKYLDALIDPNATNGAYPIIKIFLNFDILDFLNVISMSFNEPSFEAVIGLDKKQQLIDILIEISLKSSENFSLDTSTYYNNQIASHLFTFLARQIANKNNNIQIDNSIFTQMIEYLCNREEMDRIEEREQTLLSLLTSFSIQIVERFDLDRMLNLALKAKFYRACEILYEFKGDFYEIVDCYLNEENSIERQMQVFDIVRNLLNTLYETNSSQESNSLNDSFKRFSISQSNDRQRSITTLQKRSGTVILEPRDVQLKKLQEKLIRPITLKKMISMSPIETIHLLWIEMNIDLKFLIKTIKGFSNRSFKDQSNQTKFTSDSELEEYENKKPKKRNLMKQKIVIDESDELSKWDDNKSDSFTFNINKRPSSPSNDSYISTDQLELNDMSAELLYNFMKGLFELIEIIKTDRKYINYVSQFGGEYCELYVELVCRFEPDTLIYILKTTLSDYSFRIDECLRICRERQHWDGAAFLLEKSGQIEAAFTLHLEKMSSFIRELQKNLETLSDRELNILKSNIDALLIMIVQLCQRNSCSLNDGVKEKIWFSLFDEVMKPIRSLFIHPSIEALLYSEENQGDESDELVKARLNETREFFKGLGSYIINSMVGYLNLTTIIDRMICDPLYGASNFGDIKELMMKMLEMCSYEQTLLIKTSNLVSKDVYSKMLIYKKYSCKSFSSYSNFCQYCSRPLDLTPKNDSEGMSSTALANNYPNNISPSVGLNEKFVLDLDNKMTITIYQCGHSFHQSCLEMIQTQTLTACPVCNSSTTSRATSNPKPKANITKKNKTKQNSSFQVQPGTSYEIDQDFLSQLNFDDTARMNKLNNQPTTSSSLEISEQSRLSSQVDSDASKNGYNLRLTSQQINALKSIRTRNASLFKINPTSLTNQNFETFSHKNDRYNTMLEKQSKLNLAPANLIKYI